MLNIERIPSRARKNPRICFLLLKGRPSSCFLDDTPFGLEFREVLRELCLSLIYVEKNPSINFTKKFLTPSPSLFHECLLQKLGLLFNTLLPLLPAPRLRQAGRSSTSLSTRRVVDLPSLQGNKI